MAYRRNAAIKTIAHQHGTWVLEYAQHTIDGEAYRVRRSDWPSDMFNIVNRFALAEIEKFCELFGILTVDLDHQ